VTERLPASPPDSRTGGRSRITAVLRRLQRWFWRWHFWSAVVFAPLIVIASVTGGIFVWAQEIEGWLLRDLKHVPPSEERVGYDAMIEAARSEVSGTFLTLEWSGRKGESAEVYLEDAQSRVRAVWVNPHTGEALGWKFRDRLFTSQIRDLHRFLWSGVPGGYAVELATSWTIMLTLSGVVLWWNGRSKNREQWKLFRRRKPYILWRNWHSVPAVWLSAFLIIVLVTGLSFSNGAGGLWKATSAAGGAFPEEYVKPPTYDTERKRLDYETLVRKARIPDAHPYTTIVNFPESARVPWILHGDRRAKPWTLEVTWINPVSGEVIERAGFGGMSPVAQGFVAAYALHVGWIGGFWTKVLATLLCVLLVFLVVSGVVMWWLRRPAGRSGFPKRRPEDLPKWLWITNGVLCVIFPAVGASLLVYAAGDGIARGVRRLRR